MTRKPTAARPTVRLSLGDQEIELGGRTLVMGILNCTPDSFFDGGHHDEPGHAVEHYHRLLAEGADWIDVGGESTRPGAEPVESDDEWGRIAPVLEAARREGHPVPLSVDTTKYDVAARALDAGAVILNDVSALRIEPRLARLASEYHAALILMHMPGTPRTMQQDPRYGDVVTEIREELAAAIGTAREGGLPAEQILVDPGIGFGKTAAHNLEIISRMAEFSLLERPVLIGCSRKSFIGAVFDLLPEERLEGTIAAHAAAVLAGAHVVRVHDVQAHVRAMRLVDGIMAAAQGS